MQADVMRVCAICVALLLFQGPGEGWAIQQSRAREVKRLYWEVFEVTEVWVSILPEHPGGGQPLVNMVFQAFFPGRAERDPCSGLPKAPKGPPARLVLRAQPLPLTMTRELSLRLNIDSKVYDLTAPGRRYRNRPCLVSAENCTMNTVEVELEPAIVDSMITAESVSGEALGFPIKLTGADRAALAAFAERIGRKAGAADPSPR